MEEENAYSQSMGDDDDDENKGGDLYPRSSHRSSSHKKSKTKKKSTTRRENEDSPDGGRNSPSRRSEEDGEKREKKHKKEGKHRESGSHVDGSLSTGSPDGEYLSSRKPRTSERSMDGDRTLSRRNEDEYERKPAANPYDYRSSRKPRREDDDKDDGKPKATPHKTDRIQSTDQASHRVTMGVDLENRMTSKMRPTGLRPSRPGAVSESTASVASSTASNLSQFEQDVQAKNRARRSAKPVSAPGVVPVRESRSAASDPNAMAALSRLEQDALAKSRARPGAVSSTGGNQYGKTSGRTSRASASRTAAAAAAAGAQYGKTTGLNAPQPASVAQRASLRAAEDDLAAKYRADATNSTVIEPGGRKRSARATAASIGGAAVVGGTMGAAAAGSGSSSEQSDAVHAASQLESDVLAKNQPRLSATARAADEPIEPLVMHAVPEPADNEYMDSFAWQEPVSRDASSVDAAVDVSPQRGYVDGDSGSSADDEGATAEAEIYPGVDYASQDFVNEGAVEAFVADNVVDAMGVAVVMSEEEENQIERRKYTKYLIIAFLCMVLIAVAIVVPVVLMLGKTVPVAPSAAPSAVPSMAPSSAPTSVRLDAIVDNLTSVSSENDLQNKSSPQYQAAQWVADEDPLKVAIGNPRLVQRYILAVFYFSTNGDEWLECGRKDPICGGDPNEDSWLSESSECTWLANRCVNGVDVDRIFFGECSESSLLFLIMES